jgi:hypothetical protein
MQKEVRVTFLTNHPKEMKSKTTPLVFCDLWTSKFTNNARVNCSGQREEEEAFIAVILQEVFLKNRHCKTNVSTVLINKPPMLIAYCRIA